MEIASFRKLGKQPKAKTSHPKATIVVEKIPTPEPKPKITEECISDSPISPKRLASSEIVGSA